jgi:hypothetical protein
MTQRAITFSAGLLLGVLIGVGGASFAIYRIAYPDKSVVFTTTQQVHLENGVVIPAGVDLILEEEMSEGFAALSLHVNVQGQDRSLFATRVEPKQRLVIPYWVEPSNQPLHPTPTAAEAPASGAGERQR